MLEQKKMVAKDRASKDSVKFNAEKAANAYVNKGLSNLNLSYEQRQKLINDLMPVVQKRIQSDRSRTSARVQNIAKTQERKKMDKAKKALG